MAGQIAKDVNAKVLVLNHISPKVKEEHLARVVQLAERTATKSDGTASSAIVLAHDFMELAVPIKGFDDSVLVRKNKDDTDTS
jgi:ribonuclease BN (tRNA processing enzyme)